MPLPKSLLDILVCPICKGELEYRTEGQEALICHACDVTYPVEDGIPNMIPPQDRPRPKAG